jgi:TPR repeat protein
MRFPLSCLGLSLFLASSLAGTPRMVAAQNAPSARAAEQNTEAVLVSLQNRAKQGDVNAQYYLGFMYYVGQDVLQNCATAAEWYGKAAAQGHASAQFNLGNTYYVGEGVP